jgi:hypothetical protein
MSGSVYGNPMRCFDQSVIHLYGTGGGLWLGSRFRRKQESDREQDAKEVPAELQAVENDHWAERITWVIRESAKESQGVLLIDRIACCVTVAIPGLGDSFFPVDARGSVRLNLPRLSEYCLLTA